MDTTTLGYECSYGIPSGIDTLGYENFVSIVRIAFDTVNGMAAEGRTGMESFHFGGLGWVRVAVRRKF